MRAVAIVLCEGEDPKQVPLTPACPNKVWVAVWVGLAVTWGCALLGCNGVGGARDGELVGHWPRIHELLWTRASLELLSSFMKPIPPNAS